MPVFRVSYISFEGNERWTEYDMDDGATSEDVRSRIADENHTCGDEICTILAVEEA